MLKKETEIKRKRTSDPKFKNKETEFMRQKRSDPDINQKNLSPGNIKI